MSVTSKTVSVTAADGGVFNAYLALPEGGRGPALVLLQEIFGVNRYLREVADRYAEEGYVTIAPDLFWRIQPGIELGYSEAEIKAAFDFFARFDPDQAIKDVADTVRALRAMPECNGKVGAIGFCLGGMLAYLTAARCNIEAAVSYYGVGIEKRLNETGAVRCPMMLHFGELDRFVPAAARDAVAAAFKDREDVEIYVYPGADHAFNNPVRPSYDRFAASLAHSRTIGMLRHAIGPRFDLSALWERHADLEFKYRDADATMTTMVDRPYVNHVPTMTGGVGQQELHRFYKNHFIPKLPRDLSSFRSRARSEPTVWSMNSCSASPTTSRSTFSSPASRQPASTSRFRPWRSCSSAAASWCTSIFIGTRRPRWSSWAYSIRRTCPRPDARPPRSCVDETRPSNTLMKRWKDSESKG